MVMPHIPVDWKMPWNRLSPAFPLVVGEINSSALSLMASEGHFQFGMTDVEDELRQDEAGSADRAV